MEFRVFIHLSSFNLSSHNPDYVFKLLDKIYNRIQAFCEQRESYRRFNLIEKISIFVDVDIKGLLCKGKSFLGFLQQKYANFQLYKHILTFKYIGQSPLSTPGSTYSNLSKNNFNVTNTVGSELYEFQDDTIKIGVILCRSNCTAFIKNSNSILKASGPTKDILHCTLVDQALVGLITTKLSDFIYEHGTGSFPIPSQTFLRNHHIFVKSTKHPGQSVYTDGTFFYKIDRTHTDSSAHVERSLNGTFNDRVRLDIYENKFKLM